MNHSVLLTSEKHKVGSGSLSAILFIVLGIPVSVDAQILGTLPADQQNQPSAERPRIQVPNIPERPKVNITNLPGEQIPATAPVRAPQTAPEMPAPEPDIEFQRFVANSLGYSLPIFGQNLFENVPTTFAPLEYAPVTPEYLIGPGDELLIRAWGQIDITNYRAVVDRTGSIYLPSVGAISVAGLRYDRLNDYLKQAIGRYYKNFDLDVTLGRLRAIQVFVVGQVKRPGSYTVSSLSTLINALFASGGPSKRGSMRNIELKRVGTVVTTFDLYDLIVRGDKSKDAQLVPGDVIYVPPVGRLVAAAGSVNVPAVFELRDHDTLGDLIGYAGGLATTAAGQQAIIERISARQVRKADEFALTGEGLKRELQDGDIVRFLHISNRFENAVTLRGNVAVPGRYPWHEAMRVKDLIPNREFLVTEEYWTRQNSLGQNPGGESFQQQERLARPSTEPGQQAMPAEGAIAEQSVTGNLGATTNLGSVQSGTTNDQDLAARVGRVEAQRIKQEELKNQIKRSTAEINWEYAVIQRMDPNKLTSHLLPFNLAKAIEGDEGQNLLLQPGDVVTIFSQADMQVPIAQQSKFVRLEGEFTSAGVYQVQPGETLRHLVERVGGVTPQAYLFGSDFTRESVREELQRRLDEYTTDLQRTVESTRAVSPEDQARLAIQRRLVARMQRLRSTGRIVLELRPNVSSVDAYPEIVLEDGDRLFVPFRPSTVSVMGAVYNSNAFMFRPGKTVSDYLRLSGGVTRDGDKRHAFVLRANGATVSNQQRTSLLVNNFGTLRLTPGDTIVVPEKIDRGAVLRGLKDWSQLFQQFALGAAGIAVLLP